MCEEGDTSEIDVASLSTLTHVTAYIRGEVIALGILTWNNTVESKSIIDSWCELPIVSFHAIPYIIF
jgi:hypothetical protein